MPWLTPWGALGVDWLCKVVPSWGQGIGLYTPVLTVYWMQDVQGRDITLDEDALLNQGTSK